jgi:hypothetical protein
MAWRAGPLELGALLRWQLLPTRFQIRDGERLVRLFEPWRLQPGMALDAAQLLSGQPAPAFARLGAAAHPPRCGRQLPLERFERCILPGS